LLSGHHKAMREAEYASDLYRNGARSPGLPNETRAIADPLVQYARTTDGVNIAYYSIGEGPPLVYLTPVSHLQSEWRYPEQRACLERLAQRHRVIRLDTRGTGLSDRHRDFEFPLLAALDVEAVVRKEGLKRFALAGGLSAAAVAVLYAHRFPEEVSHLVLWCPYGPESVDASPRLQAVRAAATKDWDTYIRVLAELLTGWVDMDQATRYAAYLLECMDPGHFERFMERFKAVDLAGTLNDLTMPVLVLQRRDAYFPTVESARDIAAVARNARLVVLEGSAVLPFLGDTDAALSPILEFLSEPSELRPDGLTQRELEILKLVSGGSSNEEIARTLSISRRTAERHISNIYVKIGAHNRAEATAYLFRQRIVAA
jgi:pimeloyl-ACP methyl ester carboxylesterase/DNA-binding CsgD family transcriptional regulator